MPEKLLAEAEGILAWLVEGCLDWERNGLIVPAEVEVATGEYRAESDVVGRFLAECTRPVPGARVKAGEAYARFVARLKAIGEEHHPTFTAFGLRLEALGVRKEKSSCVWYRGIALVSDRDGDD
jgi:putative DNA primase/helicase